MTSLKSIPELTRRSDGLVEERPGDVNVHNLNRIKLFFQSFFSFSLLLTGYVPEYGEYMCVVLLQESTAV